jgi:hypothetical protein
VRRISTVLGSGDLAQSQTFYEQVVGLTLSTETIPNLSGSKTRFALRPAHP